jgi:amino acid transporter
MIVVIIMPVVIMPVVIMIIAMIVVIVVAMIIMVVVIIMILVLVVIIVPVIIMIVAMSMNDPIKMFCLSINSRGAEGCFNSKTAVVGQTPFEDVTELSIDGVVLRFAIEIGLKTTMPLDRDHRSGTEFSFGQLLTTAMAAMGMNTTNGSVTGKKQGQCRSGIEE